MATTTRVIEGIEFRFTRRRYGNQTYCWAEVNTDIGWVDMGDPWMGINWPKKELLDNAKLSIHIARQLA